MSLDLERVARTGVEAALSDGADDAEAFVEESVEREIRVYNSAVETLTDAGSRGLGIRAFVDGRAGYAYGTDLSEEGIAGIARAAGAAAAVADPDPDAGLPDDTGAAKVGPLRSPELDAWTTERKVGLAVEAERSALAHPEVKQVEHVVYADVDGRHALASSRGFSGAFDASAAWAYATAFSGDGSDLMIGTGLDLGRGPENLDPEAIGREAADRAVSLAGARQIPSRRCPVVFDSFVAASFLGFIGAMLSADSVQRGRSLFADREGDEIANPALRLADDGTAEGGPASAPFDGEGCPRRRLPLIEDGRLLTFLYDSRTARKAGCATTGSAERSSYRSPPAVGTSNLVVEPGEAEVGDLLRRAGDGLYVMTVVGLHSGVNPISGTFSVGATGRLIEGGEMAGPVREVTIASDLVTMLQSVDAVASERRWVPFGGSVHAAPLLLREMAVSGS